GCARNVAAAGSERFENGVEVLDDVFFAADHLAIAAIESPDAAAGADVAVVNAFGAQFFGAANVVDVRGIAAVDGDVVLVELGDEIMKSGVNNPGGHHEPDSARFLKFLDEVIERIRSGCAFAGELLDGFRAAIIDDAGVPVANQAAHHICTHTP